MTYNPDPEYAEADPNTDDRDFLQPGDHTCKITRCDVVFSEKSGEDFLVIEIEDVNDGRVGSIWQSFASERLKWLRKVCDLIFDPPPKSRDEIRDRCGEVVGAFVAVNTVKKGQYTNHYVNNVIKRAEAVGVSDDDLPF